MREKISKMLSDQSPGSPRDMLDIAWPIIIGMLSYTAMGVADTMFVGWLGKTELAAVGLATTAFFFLNAFFIGVLKGVKVVCSQACGARDHCRTVQAGWLGVMLAVPLGLMVLFLTLFDGPLFSMLGGSSAVRDIGRTYFSVRAGGAIFWYVAIALCKYYEGIGNTRVPMKMGLLANGLNILLDPLFIFGLGPIPGMGVEGAAVATVLAQTVGMVVLALRFLKEVEKPETLDWDLGGEIIKIGAPMGVADALGAGGFTVFTAFLARMGEAELAAHQVALRIVSLSALPGLGLSEATGILTGRSAGSGDAETSVRSIRSALTMAVIAMSVCALVFAIFPDYLIGLFNSDSDVVRLGTRLLGVAAIFQLFDAVGMVALGAVNGTGDTNFTMFTRMACSWALLLPFGWFFGFSLGWGAVGAWMGIAIEKAGTATISLVRLIVQERRGELVAPQMAEERQIA